MDTDDRDTVTDAPRPGDGRDPGPRPAPTLRDILWGLLATSLCGLTAVQFVGLAVALMRLPTRPSGAGLVLGFVITVVWLLTIYWLAMGAWRRGVWGCPFRHTADAPEGRRCPRHATVGTRTTGAAESSPTDHATG